MSKWSMAMGSTTVTANYTYTLLKLILSFKFSL
jgi:hypothetical protein